MPRRIWKAVTNNLGLKILAAFFAVILWMVVVNIDDPKISTRFVTSVAIENGNYLTDQGKYYEVLNDSNTVVFTVTAKRSYIEKLSSTDFKAVADMKNATIDSETNVGRVPIDVTPLRYTAQVTISKATQNLEIKLEQLAHAQFIIGAQATGTLPQGCALGEVSVTPNLLKVSGPQSVVNRIDHVVAAIDVTDMTGDVVDNVIPVLYDAAGEVIGQTDLTLNLSTVTVSAKILDTKEVSLICKAFGEPAEGFTYVDMEFSPKTVAIKGKAAALNNITAIVIPDSALDITGARNDITQTIDVTEYLPEGVTLVDPAASKVTVTVRIAQLAGKTVNLFTSGIEVLNLPENLKLTFDSSVLRVNITGIRSDIDQFDAAGIKASIDGSQLTPGTHEVDVALELQNGIDHTPVTVSVSVEEITADEPQEEEPEETDPIENENQIPEPEPGIGEETN